MEVVKQAGQLNDVDKATVKWKNMMAVLQAIKSDIDAGKIIYDGTTASRLNDLKEYLKVRECLESSGHLTAEEGAEADACIDKIVNVFKGALAQMEAWLTSNWKDNLQQFPMPRSESWLVSLRLSGEALLHTSNGVKASHPTLAAVTELAADLASLQKVDTASFDSVSDFYKLLVKSCQKPNSADPVHAIWEIIGTVIGESLGMVEKLGEEFIKTTFAKNQSAEESMSQLDSMPSPSDKLVALVKAARFIVSPPSDWDFESSSENLVSLTKLLQFFKVYVQVQPLDADLFKLIKGEESKQQVIAFKAKTEQHAKQFADHVGANTEELSAMTAKYSCVLEAADGWQLEKVNHLFQKEANPDLDEDAKNMQPLQESVSALSADLMSFLAYKSGANCSMAMKETIQNIMSKQSKAKETAIKAARILSSLVIFDLVIDGGVEVINPPSNFEQKLADTLKMVHSLGVSLVDLGAGLQKAIKTLQSKANLNSESADAEEPPENEEVKASKKSGKEKKNKHDKKQKKSKKEKATDPEGDVHISLSDLETPSEPASKRRRVRVKKTA